MTHKIFVSILGCGWLGYPLAETLSESGYKVRVSKRTLPDKNSLIELYGFKFFRIDFRDEPFAVDADFLKSEVLVISVPTSAIELDKLQQLLNAADPAILKKIILISSTGIYHDSNSLINEADEQFINTESKLFKVEKLVKSFPQFNLIVLRAAGLTGLGRNPEKYCHSHKVLANPNGRINLIYVEDLIQLLVKIIESDVSNETFNCCSDDHPTKKEFYSQLASYYNKVLPEFDKNTSDTFKIISNQKVKDYFHFEFKNIFESIAEYEPNEL